MKGLAVLAAALLMCVVTTTAFAGTRTNSKPPKGCKTVNVVLKGTVAAAPGASPTLPFGLQVTVTSDKNADAYAAAKQPVTVTVNSGTTITRDKSAAMLSNLLKGDDVVVKAKPCASDLANGATPTLTATMVAAKAAKPSK